MIKLGITGLIGSGKSTVTNILNRKGIPTFCADKTVAKIYLKDKDFKKKLIKIKPILKNSKFLKKTVTEIVLKDKLFINKVEKIIHPIIRRKIKIFIDKNKKLKKKIVALDIPLLIENKLYKNFNKILLVHCNKDLRKKRFLKSGKNIKLFYFMEKKQISFQYKKKYSDYIIVNNLSIKNTKKKLMSIIKKMKTNV